MKSLWTDVPILAAFHYYDYTDPKLVVSCAECSMYRLVGLFQHSILTSDRP